MKWLWCNISLIILQLRFPYEYDESDIADVNICEDGEQLTNDCNENVDNTISNHIDEALVWSDFDELDVDVDIHEDVEQLTTDCNEIDYMILNHMAQEHVGVNIDEPAIHTMTQDASDDLMAANTNGIKRQTMSCCKW